jgi:WD40 repeat protein
LAFSPDGGRILIADESEGLATWWSPKTGQLERSTLWHGGWLWAVALSGDGKRALVGGNGVKKGVKTAQLWSLDGPERLLFDLPHPDQVRAVAFSPDAKLAATACFDGNARLWSTDTGQPVGPPLQHSTIVEDVGFSPDGTLVVTACDDGAARIWSVEMGEPLGPALRSGSWPMEVAFSPDGKTIAVATWQRDAHGTYLWSIPSPFGSDLSDEEAELRMQVLTWSEMDANGVLGQLDRATWQARRDQLRRIADQ